MTTSRLSIATAVPHSLILKSVFSSAVDLPCVVQDLIASLSLQPIGLSRFPQWKIQISLARGECVKKFEVEFSEIQDAKGQLHVAFFSDEEYKSILKWKDLCAKYSVKSGNGQVWAYELWGGDTLGHFKAI